MSSRSDDDLEGIRVVFMGIVINYLSISHLWYSSNG